MAGIIKNQILKHLSRYVKKLSSDRINVSTLKGEGELTDLELDEEVLTELLALPIWMKIKKATCNRARLMIQWTKLKSIPIRLILDTIDIQIEACEELRPVIPTTSPHLTLPAAGKYGFVNKVVDGITVTVESVDIRFYSTAFESKVQISRIKVESKSPQWKTVDLPHTRLKDVEKGELLVFKEIEWQTLRLEAQSTKEKHLAPLRLLTNQAKARVVIKKKLSDCSVVGCRLSLILDDLLWVLTDSQILAAAHFMSSLSGLVKQATEMTHAVKAARKLETLPEYRAQQHQTTSPQHHIRSESSRIFEAFDVKETSYHLICEKIDLHFCDDPGGGRSNHPDLRDGGAGQVQLTQLMVDFYPYHLANGDRRHWPRYFNSDLNHWLKEALAVFQAQMMNLFPRSSGGLNSPVSTNNFNNQTQSDVVSSRLTDQLAKLMSTCLTLRIRDVCIYKVTTFSRETPMPFLSNYLERPKDVSAVNLEFTWFYYPGAVNFPLPCPKFYIQVNPLQLNIDVCTILWMNSFLTNIQTSMPQTDHLEDPEYVDIRLELIMPKVVFEEKVRYPARLERPNAFQVQASRIIISNYRSSETGTLINLGIAIDEIGQQCLMKTENFKIPEKFIAHAKGKDKVNHHHRKVTSHHDSSTPQFTTEMLWTEARDIWHISVDTVWADFCVDPKFKTESNGSSDKRKFRSATMTSQSDTSLLPFIDSVPLSVWLYMKEELIDPEFSMGKRKDIQALLRTDGMCNIQLTHQQYLFLLRAAEAVSEISLFLTIDTRKTYIVPRIDDSVELFGCLPRLEISFILPYTETSDLPREGSSLLDDTDPAADPIAFDVPNNKIPPQNSEWNSGPEEKPNAVGSLFIPESPEKFYNDYQPGPLSTTPVDNLKTSLTHGMKQGLSSLVVSFSKGHSTPDSEVQSMWSTDSSENNFIHLDPEHELAPPYQTLNEEVEEEEEAVEVAEEVIEDNSQSTGSFSVHNPYGKEDTLEINVLAAALSGLQIRMQSQGLSSDISFGCKSLTVNEHGQIPWKEFQTLFATRIKKWRADHNKKNSKTDSNNAIVINFNQKIDDVTFMNCITSEEMMDALKQVKTSKCPRVNLIDRPGPESPIRKAINESTHPILKAIFDLSGLKINDGQIISLHSNVIKAVGEFFEDEIPPVILPLEATVTGGRLEIVEDKDPNLPPTQLRLESIIKVTRSEDGIFSIDCPCDKTNVPKKLLNGGDRKATGSGDGETIDDLKQTVAELRKKVTELEKDKSTLLNQLNQHQPLRKL